MRERVAETRCGVSIMTTSCLQAEVVKRKEIVTEEIGLEGPYNILLTVLVLP